MYAYGLERKRTKLSPRSKTREYKKKRREQRERKGFKVRLQENREGVHYEVFWDRGENLESLLEIPSPIIRPEVKQVTPTTALKKVTSFILFFCHFLHSLF